MTKYNYDIWGKFITDKLNLIDNYETNINNLNQEINNLNQEINNLNQEINNQEINNQKINDNFLNTNIYPNINLYLNSNDNVILSESINTNNIKLNTDYVINNTTENSNIIDLLNNFNFYFENNNIIIDDKIEVINIFSK